MNKIVTPSRDFSALETLESEDHKITVLNPMGFPPKITRKTAAPRPESLDGKTSIWSTAGSTIRSNC